MTGGGSFHSFEREWYVRRDIIKDLRGSMFDIGEELCVYLAFQMEKQVER